MPQLNPVWLAHCVQHNGLTPQLCLPYPQLALSEEAGRDLAQVVLKVLKHSKGERPVAPTRSSVEKSVVPLLARAVGGPRALKQLLITQNKAGLVAALQGNHGNTAVKTAASLASSSWMME